MEIRELFPLRIYSETLEDFDQHKRALLDRIYTLRDGSGRKRTSRRYNWTGDTHGVDALHNDPAFDWLTDQLSRNVVVYMQELGHNLDNMDVHIQRSWPVIGTRGQSVKKHAHLTAHLSSVLYIKVPEPNRKAGRISFYNDAKPNQLASGMDSSMTDAIDRSNPFNQRRETFTPREGMLILFPAKVNHAVAENDTDEDRVSVSFDIILTARADRIGTNEHLMPAPVRWKSIALPDRTAATLPSPLPIGVQPRPKYRKLTDLTKYNRSSDRYVLADTAGHVLWEPFHSGNVSSRADGRKYAEQIADSPPDGWTSVNSGTLKKRRTGKNWPARRNLAERLLVYLRDRRVSVEGATVSSPRVLRLANHKEPKLSRITHHMCAYLRLDHDAKNSVAVIFADGTRMDIEPGAVVFASGLRRHALEGSGLVMNIGVDIPAVARLSVLEAPFFADDDVSCDLIFACATVEPLAAVLPDPTDMKDALRRRASLERNRLRSGDCPVLNRFLIQNADPASATGEELAIIEGYGRRGDGAGEAPVVLQNVDALDPEACIQLIDYAQDHMTSVAPDTVDGMPEYQVNLKLRDLQRIVGTKASEAIYRLSEHIDGMKDVPLEELAARNSVFIRKYSPDTRKIIAFHADRSAHTINVALNDPSEFEGGDLLIKTGDTLHAAERQQGKAIHGVSRTISGERWTLIVFYKGPGRTADKSEVA